VVAPAPASVPPPHRLEPPAVEEPPRTRFTPPDEPAVIIPPAPEPAPDTPAEAPHDPPAPPPAAAPGLPPPRRRRSPPPLTQAQPAPPLPTPSPAPRRRVLGWVTRSLVWSNRTFDRSTSWLGAPGRWLRGPQGRAVLGWVGLGLWAAALTLALLHFLG
jgi:hypothetical protein